MSGRPFGSCESIWRSKCTASGMCATLDKSAIPFMMLASRLKRPPKGCSPPVSKKCKTQPSAKTSTARVSRGLLLSDSSSSGARQPCVPAARAAVVASKDEASAVRRRAMPISESFARPSAVTKTFEGLMSRWMTLFSCRWNMPSTTSRASIKLASVGTTAAARPASLCPRFSPRISCCGRRADASPGGRPALLLSPVLGTEEARSYSGDDSSELVPSAGADVTSAPPPAPPLMPLLLRPMTTSTRSASVIGQRSSARYTKSLSCSIA
mmetsp:Transcript_9847/g.30858  ORF Transcript_9847/g.30858 Transcript_9847/m.30858 type:complete len:268 (+) Transcript_9847:338-1141(+)